LPKIAGTTVSRKRDSRGERILTIARTQEGAEKAAG
jgi:hypothetical protein